MVVESNRFDLKEAREETLDKRKMMGFDANMVRVGSSEDGEISDLESESIQDINKVDFKDASDLPKRTPTPDNTITTTITMPTAAAAAATTNSSSSYWRDLYKYSYPRTYPAAGLYHLAWAQAVQNKPLNDVLVEFEQEEKSGRSQAGDEKNNSSSNDSLALKDDSKDDNGNDVVRSEGGLTGSRAAVMDDEKEEGELEEGEIEMDSEPNEAAEKSSNSGRLSDFEMEVEDEELERRVESIREVLDNVNGTEAEKSFDFVCARLKISLENLKQLVMHCWFPSKDELIQLSFAAVQCVISVFSSMSHIRKDQTKNSISRLLTFVVHLKPPLFAPEQMNEVRAMVSSVSAFSVPLRTKTGDQQEELPVNIKPILTDSNSLAVDAINESNSSVGALSKDASKLLDVSRPIQTSNSLSKMGFGPLFDLHKVHDEDSLPSPTSRTPADLPLAPTIPPNVVSRSEAASSNVDHAVEKPCMHYETDAVKAVSSYQQKFGRSSFLSFDRLPSPTPSEDGNGGEADDGGEEASSASPAFSTQTTSSTIMPQSLVSTPSFSRSGVQGLVNSNSGLPGPDSITVSRPSAKSRDPRLRYMNPSSSALDLNDGPLPVATSSVSKLEPLGEIINSKKHKITEFPDVDSPALKKLRNGLETGAAFVPQNVNRSQLGTVPTDPRKLESAAVSSGTVVTSSSMATVSSGQTANSKNLESLLKDIAVNPAAWMNAIKGQHKFGDLGKSSVQLNPSLAVGVSPLPIVAPQNSSLTGIKSTGSMQIPPQPALTSTEDDSVKLRMKPRDPRRALQANSTQNGIGSVPWQSGKSEAPTVAVQRGRDFANGTVTSSASSHPMLLPDIAKKFTSNLKSIADIITVSQSSMPPVVSQNSPSAVEVSLDRVNVRSGEPEATRPVLRPEQVAAVPAHSQNWGDVEHLFEKYDEQEKVAIQRERARRMDEQNKMFSARKLCLVLDLDHTLLNSAKFAEVDPVHDEILRKKEEQDRDKPQRHLFRFPHMGMWTKLRPGIWNFLEKACKLYELHLYTMGNKLYATEMAKVLDPKGVLFAGRVISRGDDGDILDGDDRAPKSKDLEGVLGMESSVVIIDDSVRVWPHNKLNLIVVERYIYFPCSRRQFGLPGPSLLEIDHDERTEDGTLASLLAVIERIHQNFFSNKSLDDVDVRNILASEQRRILAGCRIVFSRVFPVGEANPHLHPLWQTAEQFGAVCTNQIDDQVTHVVANSLGTDKVNWAMAMGRYVVYPGWVEASALLYRRANEQDFAIKL